jgi:hypothetical protein
LGLKANKNHPWLSRESGESNVDVDFEIPSDLQDGKRAHLSGITGFDVAGEVRLIVNDITEKENKAHLSYGTWGDTKLSELGYMAFYFDAPVPKVFDSLCAEIFSACHFEGSSMKVCDDKTNLEDFKFDIKSVHIPTG